MKRILKLLPIVFCTALAAAFLWIAFAFLGNPVSWGIARVNASRYLDNLDCETDIRISKVGYNFKTGNYYAHMDSPSSIDSHFSVYFDGWGQYKYDTYSSITQRYTTLSRLDDQYRELVKSAFPYGSGIFDISIAYGELREAELYEIHTYMDEKGNSVHYTLQKDYGLDRTELELDKEYSIHDLGRKYGHIVLYLHDSDLSIESASSVLLEVKKYADARSVPIHAIEFHLCEPRNENGQYTAKEITLFDFLYSDITEEGLTEKVREHWLIAQEHYAIQDGLKKYPSEVFDKIKKISINNA